MSSFVMPRPQSYETQSDSTLPPHSMVTPELPRSFPPPTQPSGSPVPDQKPGSNVAPQNHQDEMPDWWKSDFDIEVFPPLGYPLRFFFRLACVTASGHADLQDVWAACHDLEKWKNLKERMAARVAVVTLVASLVLPTAATFLCAEPPRSGLLDFTQRAPYICLMLTLALAADSVMVGACLAYVAAEFSSKWFITTLMSSRSRVYCTLMMVAFPLGTLTGSMMVFTVGLLCSAWSTDSRLVHIGGMITLLIPIPLVPMFLWTQMPVVHLLVDKEPAKMQQGAP